MNNSSIEYVTLDDIKLTVFSFVNEYLKFDQPLPSFQSADKNKLDSILASIQQSVDGRDAYRSFEEKSAVLFYRMIKDHPFLNGNKRMAIVALLLFLAKNGKWLSLPWESLYNIATRIAESKPIERREILVFISDLLSKSFTDTSTKLLN